MAAQKISNINFRMYFDTTNHPQWKYEIFLLKVAP
jgi:hypothetical protein